MSICKRPIVTKGSEHWLRVLLEREPDKLSRALNATGIIKEGEAVEWISPRIGNCYVEYRDADFLKVLGLDHLADELLRFWPRGGPQWDGLGKSAKKIFLIEAKSHIGEIDVGGTGARHPESLQLIRKRLLETQVFLGANTRLDWSQVLYQTGNRLAHLYWLAERQQIDAYLLNIYFARDTHARGATSEQWEGAVRAISRIMGLRERHALSRRTFSLFFDVHELSGL